LDVIIAVDGLDNQSYEELFKNVEEKNTAKEKSYTQNLPEIKPETKPEIKLGIKPEIKPEIKTEIKSETKIEIKPETKPEIKPEINTFKFDLSEPFTFVKQDIEKDRENILDRLSDEYGEYPTITEDMMKEIYEYYNTHFFYGLLRKQVGNKGIIFEVSNKATRAAGSARMSIPIRVMLSEKIFSEVTEKNILSVTANGLHVTNRMDAILRVMEHELTHVILSTSDDDSHLIEGHGNLFKTIVLNLFGHTATTHSLIVSKNLLNKQRLSKDQVEVDDYVSFILKDGKIVTGKILKKNPIRAKVKITDGRIFGVPYSMMFVSTDTGDNDLPGLNMPAYKKSTTQGLLYKDMIRIGDKIKFKNKDKFVQGKITKKNPKRAVVLTADGKEYAVPYEYIYADN
jgi:hypothetical protein